MKNPPTGAARSITEQFSADQAIVLVFRKVGDQIVFSAVSHGRTSELGERAHATMEAIASGLRDGTIPKP
jgi:hypothetical protein